MSRPNTQSDTQSATQSNTLAHTRLDIMQIHEMLAEYEQIKRDADTKANHIRDELYELQRLGTSIADTYNHIITVCASDRLVVL